MHHAKVNAPMRFCIPVGHVEMKHQLGKKIKLDLIPGRQRRFPQSK